MNARSVLSAILLVPVAAALAAAGTAIVVDPRPFPSIEAAASGEAKVDWLDADPADDFACTACFAALELQRYLRKMTGREADFTLVAAGGQAEGDLIVLARPSAEDGPEEGYRIATSLANGRQVTTLTGGGRVGTLYAAYDLLYRLGCRWFAPGDVHEEIPTLKLERLPVLDVMERPAFVTRGFHAWEDRASTEFLLWMARNRLNY